LQSTFQAFETYISEASEAYGSKNIYYYAGDDFQFFNTERFEALERLMSFYSERKCQGIEVVYSGPGAYFQDLVSRKHKQW
jgi:hypothetical protein